MEDIIALNRILLAACLLIWNKSYKQWGGKKKKKRKKSCVLKHWFGPAVCISVRCRRCKSQTKCTESLRGLVAVCSEIQEQTLKKKWREKKKKRLKTQHNRRNENQSLRNAFVIMEMSCEVELIKKKKKKKKQSERFTKLKQSKEEHKELFH